LTNWLHKASSRWKLAVERMFQHTFWAVLWRYRSEMPSLRLRS
jgi:hypothetical protein